MRLLFLLILLIPTISFADKLVCSGGYPTHGKYIGMNSGEIAEFKTDDGRTVLFSFTDCHVFKG